MERRRMERKEEEAVVGVPVSYESENQYQKGVIPPNAFVGDPKGVPIHQTIYRDTPAPFNCPFCANTSLTTIKYSSSILQFLINLKFPILIIFIIIYKQIKAQFGCFCWMLDADDAWSLLSLPFNGLSLA